MRPIRSTLLAIAVVLGTAITAVAQTPELVRSELERLLRSGHSGSDEVSALSLARAARSQGVLPAASRLLFDTGRYDATVGRFKGSLRGSFLREMGLGRPAFASPNENDATDAEVRRLGRSHGMAYDCIIVPGYTPSDARRGSALHPAAADRCKRAASDFAARRAPFVIVSGGNVYPSGTSANEALLMKAELVRRGVPANRILVEAYARHSTTNLRNAGRFMLDRSLRRGLIVTSLDQSFYFSWPLVSSFSWRCRSELGYGVGSLRFVDYYRTRFEPSDNCRRVRYEDPLDW